MQRPLATTDGVRPDRLHPTDRGHNPQSAKTGGTAGGVMAGSKNGGSQMKQNPSSKTPNKENEVWVRKWVDYSSKYGLGYYLSNDATGVFFNDSTKIVLDPNGYHFDYVERRTADRQDFGYQYSLAEYPKDL